MQTKNSVMVQAIYAGGQQYQVREAGYGSSPAIVAANLPSVGSQPSSRPLPEIPALQQCLLAGALCHDPRPDQPQVAEAVVDAPTADALLAAAQTGVKLADLIQQMPCLDSIPFEPESSYMATLHATASIYNTFSNGYKVNFLVDSASHTIYVKGSVEAVLERCEKTLDASMLLVSLDQPVVKQAATAMATQGLNVMAFAAKVVSPEQMSLDQADLNDLVFLGLQGMMDGAEHC